MGQTKKISYETARSLVERVDEEKLTIYYGTYEDGQLVGVIGRKFRAWYATELCHLFVNPQFRNKGIGTGLIKYALEKAKTPLVIATIVDNNYASAKAFGKCGFRWVETIINPNTSNKVGIYIYKK